MGRTSRSNPGQTLGPPLQDACFLTTLFLLLWPVKAGDHSSAYRIDSVHKLPGLAELHEALTEIVQGPFHQHLLLLVVVQQVVPERLLGQRLRVANNNYAIPAERRARLETGPL